MYFFFFSSIIFDLNAIIHVKFSHIRVLVFVLFFIVSFNLIHSFHDVLVVYIVTTGSYFGWLLDKSEDASASFYFSLEDAKGFVETFYGSVLVEMDYFGLVEWSCIYGKL